MSDMSQLTLSDAEKKKTPDHANHNTKKEKDLLRKHGRRNEGITGNLS
jgi:hypothetical protein